MLCTNLRKEVDSDGCIFTTSEWVAQNWIVSMLLAIAWKKFTEHIYTTLVMKYEIPYYHAFAKQNKTLILDA